jgi:predicted nucleic acid-binding protein
VTGIVVADAGPLIGLARIDRLDLLHALYGTVAIPTSVLSELRVSADRPGSRALTAVLAEGAIAPRSLAAGCESELARLSRVLDAGDASAILLAEQLQARFLLIDERWGRQVARVRGLPLSESLAYYWLPGGPGVSPRSVRCSASCRNNITGSRMRWCTRFCAWPVSSTGGPR